MDLTIILPAYKEADNLRNILPKINLELKDSDLKYEILAIDTTESTDDTKEVCSEYNATYINREEGNMYGDAIRTGFKYSNGKYTLVMDADGSHNPKDILRLYSAASSGNYHLVIGSRYCKGGNTDNNFILKTMSWSLNFTYRLAFGMLNIKDISNSFRVYKTNDIQSLKLECENFDIVEEILIKLKYSIKDLQIKEVPIHFSKRDKGESKRDLFKFILSYLKTLKKLKSIESNIVK